MSSSFLLDQGIGFSKDSSDFAGASSFYQRYPARTTLVKSSGSFNGSAGQYFTVENLSNIVGNINGLTIIINSISNNGSYVPMEIQLKMGSPYSTGSWYTSGYRTLTELLGGAYTPPSSSAIAAYYDESYIRGPLMSTTSGTDSKVIIRVHGGSPSEYIRPTVEATHCTSSTAVWPIVQRSYGSLPGTQSGFQGIRFRVNPDSNWYAKVAVYATYQ